MFYVKTITRSAKKVVFVVVQSQTAISAIKIALFGIVFRFAIAVLQDMVL